MYFEKGQLYHLYNQGNNHQKVFYNEENYRYFLRKVKIHLLPFCDIVAYCLMPNHFHFMVRVNEIEVYSGESFIDSQGATPSRTLTKPVSLNHSIGILLSSYTRAINKQENFSGSLFRTGTKVECLSQFNGVSPSFIHTKSGAQINIHTKRDYPIICFNYIHQNPVKANLV